MKWEWFRSLDGEVVGSFTLMRLVGEGNIGVVYEAVDNEVEDRRVALKIIPGQPRSGWEHELKKVSLLSDIPNVVHFHGVNNCRLNAAGKTKVFMYTVWDYVPPGRSLRDFLKTEKSIPPSFLIALVEQVLRVLHACRSRGIKRHGDLHAGNILIGDTDSANLDSQLRPREPVYVSDFGYGATGGKEPKDDYEGLASICREVFDSVDLERATAADKATMDNLWDLLAKLLGEGTGSEQVAPVEVLRAVREIKQRAERGAATRPLEMKVGQFQVTEMLGDDWKWWKALFVPSLPARSRILERDINTVVTGPRGCGKTMLFRRLSERLMEECGPVPGVDSDEFVGFYVNANDIAAAFDSFPKNPNSAQQRKLTCFSNLCLLQDFLSVLAVKANRRKTDLSDGLLRELQALIGGVDEDGAFITGESVLDRFRVRVERIKWGFSLTTQRDSFPGYDALGHYNWLTRFAELLRAHCDWLEGRSLFFFVDDYTSPRINPGMQRTLNSTYFQRSSEFVFKVATESATTFHPEDSTRKLLQEGDDYRLIDMGEESLFMNEEERAAFVFEVFARRLVHDTSIADEAATLNALLGTQGLSKTEFARRLRGRGSEESSDEPVERGVARRGATKPKVLYSGADTFVALWSGDTRILIQLIQDLVDEATTGRTRDLTAPISSELQDRVLRNRGARWLESQTRNTPSDPNLIKKSIAQANEANRRAFSFAGGSYGTHLKAIVEAFQHAARALLLSQPYILKENGNSREVPRMAFRIEVVDEFRLPPLAAEIYSDLIRYGLFMRDARGRSVRGAMVPRLYLRRLLLPYCLLALSKRDSVSMSCDWFIKLLVSPDDFRQEWVSYRFGDGDHPDQIRMPFLNGTDFAAGDAALYDDLPQPPVSSDEEE